MPSVFVSYRRTDSAGWTGRIVDRLVQRYGGQDVFYDVDSIAAGEDFIASVEAKLAISQVVLAIVGPDWLGGVGEGERRIESDEDYVRREIELALGRSDVTLIPVLVSGASMPDVHVLPASIASFASRNALTISDTGFNEDLGRLLQAIERVAGPPRKQRSRRPRWLAGLGVGAALLVAFGVARYGGDPAQPSSSVTQSADPGVDPPPADVAAILGEDAGIERYCQGFEMGAHEMLQQMKYGGAVFPDCVSPNNVGLFNFVEAWCHGFSDGASQAARQLSDELLSVVEIKRRYDLCVATRRWQQGF